MWKKISEYFGDAYPAETPEAKEWKEVRVDYTRAPERPNEELNWVATTDGVVVHESKSHEEILRLLGHPDENDPHAYGIAEVNQNWKVLWDITASNMAIHVLEKMLKKETKRHGWKLEGISANGDLVSGQKTAMAAHPEFVQEWIAENGPYLYHGVSNGRNIDPNRTDTIEQRVERIRQEGLKPNMRGREPGPMPAKPDDLLDDWSNLDDHHEDWRTEHDEWMHHPRPDHVFLATHPDYAYGDHVFRVDLRKLDPTKLKADEDWYRDNVGWDYDLSNPKTMGQQAQEMGLGDSPIDTHQSMEDHGSIAHEGPISPDAIEYIGKPHRSWETRASVEGIGEQIPQGGWRGTDGDGNWGQDVKQVDYYGIDNPTDGVGMCPDCGIPLPNYNAWTRHRIDHEPLQTGETSDDVFPADERLITPTHKMEVMGSLDEIFKKMDVNDAQQKAIMPQLGEELMDHQIMWKGDTLLAWKEGEAPKQYDWMQDRWVRTSANKVGGPVPFVFDVEQDHIYAGHPGERHSEIQGRFSPGGVVRGFYMPNGEMQIRSETDMPYTLYGLTRLWYYLYPELEIKGIKSWINGNLIKMASKDIGHSVINVAYTYSAARKVIETLTPYGNVFIVGGAVRDVIMGKTPKDIDLVVAGIEPDTMTDLLSHVGRIGYHGKTFGVFRFRDDDGSEVEIALPRTERSTGDGKRDFDIVSDHNLPIEHDLGRRDYSVNAVAVNAKTGELIDPYGAVDDLKMGQFSLINDNAFQEDPTRLLRGITLVSKHNLAPDPATADKMRQDLSALTNATPESVGMEMDKILSGTHPSEALRMAMDLGLLEHWMPELHALNGFDQKNKYHSRLLDDHTLTVLDNMASRSDDVDLRWSALLHDIGKPDSQWFDDEGWAHYYHDKEGDQGADHADLGSEMAERLLRRLKFPNDRVKKISEMVGHHMFPVFTKPSGARRFLQNVGDHAEDLMDLRWADAGGKDYDYHPQIQLMTQLVRDEKNKATAVTQKDLNINGNDLIQAGFTPGVEMGQTLDYLLQRVIENPELNEKDILLNLAQEASNG